MNQKKNIADIAFEMGKRSAKERKIDKSKGEREIVMEIPTNIQEATDKELINILYGLMVDD